MNYNDLVKVDYKARMYGYYPTVITDIEEFKAILDAEYPEISAIVAAKDRIAENAYLVSMDAERLEQWEHALGITPLEDSTLEDRRETIMARIKSHSKLNTATIESIVKTFTGGEAKSTITNSVLTVEIKPPKDGKEFRIENVTQEIQRLIPAHLGFNIKQSYVTWGDVKNKHASWNTIKTSYADWAAVKAIFPD